MSDLLPRLLHPAFWHWQRQPAEMYGFWHWTGSEDLRGAVHRTGANATSLHLPLHLLKEERARYGVRPLPAPVQVSTRRSMVLEFDAPAGLTQVNLLVTTSNSHAEAVGELFVAKASATPLARAHTEPRRQPHLVLQPAKPLPAGRYRVRIGVRKSHAHVWLGQAVQEDTLVRMGDLTLRGWGIIGECRDAGGKVRFFTRASRHDTPVPLGTSTFATLANLRVDAGAGIGEHNNAFFVVYPDWFWQMHPQAAMRDRDGNIIRAGENPWIAFDDPVLTDATLRQMRETVPLLRQQKRVRYWVIGGEQGYPDYFGLPEGDFRPESLAHYRAWCRQHGLPENGDVAQWRRFREAVMTERFALYTAHLRQLDATRPVFIPTHGNPFALDFRVKMGYPLTDLAGAADGFEAGPISIDDDAERLHRLTLDMQTSFGVMVVAPRLANKQLDSRAQGGGRSFSPASARRAVYEALGMGVWHIGLVQWRGSLPDGEWGISGTPAEAACKRLFGELRAAALWLEGCARLQPQVGIFISDATWRRWWQHRWTLLYNVACSRGWHTLFVHDAQCDADLARAVPVLLSVDNPVLSAQAHRALGEYLRAGGKVVAVGALAEKDEHGNDLALLPGNIIRLSDDAPGEPVTVSHQTSTDRGAATWSVKVRPLPVEQIERQLEQMALLRPVQVTNPDDAGWAKGVECLPLADGTNLVVVLLHRTNFAREVQVSLDSQLLQGNEPGYTVRDAISGQVLSRKLPVRVSLQPFGTRLLVLEREASRAVCEAQILNAENTIRHWRRLGVDTAAFEAWLAAAHSHCGAQRFAKAFALSRQVTESLAIRPAVTRAGSEWRIEATVWQPDGKPAARAQVRVRLVPDTFRWRTMEPQADGRYSLVLKESDVPRVYNPMEAKYMALTDGLLFVIEARLGSRRGGAWWTLTRG
ncbi:MAG: hypothetical protein K6U75_12600 [Firmicutes bacterium]|nr:hypothetical protein [Bacillota bacterium]